MNTEELKNELISPIECTSKSTKNHQFFERYLDNDLEDLSDFLHLQYERIENGEIIKGNLEQRAFASTGSISTMNWRSYNVFQFYHPSINNLFNSVRDMTKQACNYYEIDYDAQKYYTAGWFNINYKKVGKLNWHDHFRMGAPAFHGYYSVSAEPSITHYSVFDKYVSNINKNNRAILSEMGHPHAQGDWDWDGPRITIAYDVLPMDKINYEWEQHWIPL
jgi:hypothetical protein